MGAVVGGLTYERLLNRTLELYRRGDYSGAYDFITRNAEKVNGNVAQVYNFRYSLASRAKRYDLALGLMREAIIDRGFWYSYDYLIEDDDLRPLGGDERFRQLVSICKEREDEAKRNTRPDLKLVNPIEGHGDKRPSLFIALHGNQQNMRLAEENWSSSVLADCILALPQSSQIDFSDAFGWNDLEKGARELKEHVERILSTYDVDPGSTIIGGFSAGARLALYSILHDVVDVKGFLFVGPWLPEIDVWEPLLVKLRNKGIRGHVICGDKDADCFESSNRFAKMLDRAGVVSRYDIAKGMDHDFPDDFKQNLPRFINDLKELQGLVG